ncbi:hypothetical protein IKD98_00220 [Candidatus Saccharibacteria bacterium]|nr:hypothetical protein [Candidatus Saccharibacteria bacterium]MBR3122261.1 hypothetical protein [Candidatus Saccharibacteria bacterium]
MDPSKNNSFGSSDSGGINPSNVGTPNDATSAGGGSAVNPMPDSAVVSNPAPNVVSNNMGQTGPMPINNARRFGSIPTGSVSSNPMPINSMPSSSMATNSMQSNPMATNSFSMMNGPMPVASGTGDIVLSKDSGGKNPKKWWIVGGVAGAVIVMVLVVFAIMGTGGGFGAKATDLRSAFNIYANYFLTGEAKNEDLPESNEASMVSFELEYDDADGVENEDEIEMAENVEEVDGEDLTVDESEESFFYKNAGKDESADYRTNLKDYFETFYGYYTDVWQDNEEAMSLIEEYKVSFDFMMMYFENDDISERDIIEVYNDGGEAAAKEYVNTIAAPFENLDDIYGNNYYNLVARYGLSEVALVKKYKELGCLIDEEINYECLDDNEDVEKLAATVTEYDYRIARLLDDVEIELHAQVYAFADIVYNDLVENEEDADLEVSGE